MPKTLFKMRDFYKKHKEEILYVFGRMAEMDAIEKQKIHNEIFDNYKRKNKQYTSLEIEEALDYASK